MTPIADVHGRFLRNLRVSVTDRCNLRCGYCMPEEEYVWLPRDDILHFGEMAALADVFLDLGVDKVRLTGGEPLLRRDLPRFIRMLATKPRIRDLAMTTNGVLLAEHAPALKAAGLHRVTVSLDALDPALFKELSGGRGEVAHVLKGIEAAQAAGFGPIKLNCVVQRGINEGEVLPLVEFARSHGHIIRFIEYMDVGTCNGWRRERVVPSAELRDRIQAQWPLQPLGAQYRGEVASRYGFADGRGEVGFVSSVSEPFCGDCHRARVSADGRLYTCLFAAEGHDLRPVLPLGQEAVARHLAERWSRRSDRYSELRGSAKAQRKHVEMYLVGG